MIDFVNFLLRVKFQSSRCTNKEINIGGEKHPQTYTLTEDPSPNRVNAHVDCYMAWRP